MYAYIRKNFSKYDEDNHTFPIYWYECKEPNCEFVMDGEGPNYNQTALWIHELVHTIEKAGIRGIQ